VLKFVTSQDNLPEYRKLLGFLNSGEQENGSCVDTADALVMSKVDFKSHIAYEHRANSSKILEHWVPAYISQLQLEIYCSILISNSSVLQSSMKSDGSLSDIVMSLSKVCLAKQIYSLQSAVMLFFFFCEVTDTVMTLIYSCLLL
jgi:chromodomain-helicase-DNA-binding protein 4